MLREPILLIDMGGTIAEGAPTAISSPHEIRKGAALRFLSARRAFVIERMVACDRLHFSEEGSPDLAFEDWVNLARLIWEHRSTYRGFVITHGTDSLAWVAAVLSFALAGLPITVVLTGAMNPIGRRGGDGWRNLLHSVRLAARSDIVGVYVAFGNRLFHGCRIRKLVSHVTRAFDAPAGEPLASLGKELRFASGFEPQRAIDPHFRLLIEGSASARFQFARGVVVVPVTPTLSPSVVRQLSSFEGIVVETYASGTIPRRLLPVMEELAQTRVVVVSVENGRRTAPAWPDYPSDITSARDMTREAVVVKLMWALANLPDRASVRRLIGIDLVGEISPESPEANWQHQRKERAIR